MMLFEKAIQTQLLIAVGSSEVLNDIHMLLPIFRHYTSVDVDSAGRAEIVRMLRIFTKMCHLDEEDEPHPQNQKILYNLGQQTLKFYIDGYWSHLVNHYVFILYRFIAAI